MGGVEIMSKLHSSAGSAVDNKKSLQELLWAIEMSRGQFSLMLARCNSVTLREKMVQQLREICPVEIQEIVLDRSVNKLYSTIREQLGDEIPSVVMVLGFESVSEIDRVLTSANHIREEFRKNFRFPLILWVNDEILQKLIRLAPDLESWITRTQFDD